jgi:hypothetical protein
MKRTRAQLVFINQRRSTPLRHVAFIFLFDVRLARSLLARVPTDSD